jgi:hypothetical protein
MPCPLSTICEALGKTLEPSEPVPSSVLQGVWATDWVP